MVFPNLEKLDSGRLGVAPAAPMVQAVVLQGVAEVPKILKTYPNRFHTALKSSHSVDKLMVLSLQRITGLKEEFPFLAFIDSLIAFSVNSLH